MRTTRTSRGPGPEGSEYGHDSFVQAENFARALDHGLRRGADPALSRELAVVATLRQAGAMARPDPSERDRMRQRIMAEFPAIVHDGTSPVLPLRHSRRPSRRRHAMPDEARGRFVIAVAAALCLFMSLSGMSLLLSRDALPGDALYTFKRSAEAAELGLTFGDEPKALKHLEFAGARVGEIEVLAEQTAASGSWSAEQDKFLRALEDFELDATAGARLLTTTVAASGEAERLAPLRRWAEQQQTRLQAVQGALPLPASVRLDSTLELLDRVIARVAALEQRAGCRPLTSGAHDDLGVLPARGACASGTSNDPSATEPRPEGATVPGAGPAGGLLLPGLLAPPSDPSDPASGQANPLSLPTSPEDALPSEGDPDGGAAQPGPGSAPAEPALPLPAPGRIPLLPLLPLEEPHVE